MGDRLRARLDDIQTRSALLGDIRGKGLLLAVEMVADKETKHPVALDLGAVPDAGDRAAHGLALYCRRTGAGKVRRLGDGQPAADRDRGRCDELAERFEATLAELEPELRREGNLVLPLTGYLDRISARRGAGGGEVQQPAFRPVPADLVRIRCADPNPDGPGMQIEPVPCGFEGEYPSHDQPVRIGSCAVMDTPGLDLPNLCTLAIRVQPGLLDATPHVVLAPATWCCASRPMARRWTWRDGRSRCRPRPCRGVGTSCA